MNFIFTIAGRGSRLSKAGIQVPKPLVKVKGKELFIWAMSSFHYSKNDNIYIISFKSHEIRKYLEKKIEIIYPQCNIYWQELNEITNGQLSTTIKAIDHFHIDGSIIIHNCDSYFNGKDLCKVDIEDSKDLFGIIPCFEANGEHWSFVKVKENNIAIKVKEKIRISNNCSIGTYFFSSTIQLKELANKYFNQIDSMTNEFYIAPLYDYAIKQGKKVIICEAPGAKVFGTADELAQAFDIELSQVIINNDPSRLSY